MEYDFKGKTVLVTGAGWGIGAAAALLYATYGANVIVSDTSRKWDMDPTVKLKGQKGNVTYIKADMSNAAACEALIRRTIEIYGSIDIACNNSAIFIEPPHPANGSGHASDHQVAFNLQSRNNCMKYEIAAMQKHGGGIIVNTSSMAGVVGSAALSPYVETKFGTAPPLENIPVGYPAIHINTIVRARIANAFLKDLGQRESDSGRRLFPIEGYAAIQEVARLVLWLSTDAANNR